MCDGADWSVITAGAGFDVGESTDTYGIAVDAAGRIYIADTGAHRIQTYVDGAWNVIAEGVGSGLGQFSRPRGVAIYPPAVSR